MAVRATSATNVDTERAAIAMNKITFGSDAADAYQDGCPKCGGTKPTCCSCPDVELPNDQVPKLITTKEWESLSAESRFRINAYFAALPAAAETVRERGVTLVDREDAAKVAEERSRQSGVFGDAASDTAAQATASVIADGIRALPAYGESKEREAIKHDQQNPDQHEMRGTTSRAHTTATNRLKSSTLIWPTSRTRERRDGQRVIPPELAIPRTAQSQVTTSQWLSRTRFNELRKRIERGEDGCQLIGLQARCNA